MALESDTAVATAAVPVPAQIRDGSDRRRLRLGLSGRLFLVTVAFVVAAEVLTYVPAVANYRIEWMSDRLAAAQVAALVLDGRTGEPVSEALESRLLAGVNARAIAVRGGGTQRLLAIEAVPERVADTVDLRDVTAFSAIRGAWRTLVAPTQEPIRVVGEGGIGFDRVEILLDEAPLRSAMVDYALRLLVSSLIIAASAAGLVFVVLQVLIMRPVRRLVTSITAFADDPEDAGRIIAPSRRSDEIGQAELALGQMQRSLADQLRQKRRLAELGLAVSKISHELRNLLTGAQLLGDRLEGTADPTVQRVAPRLVGTLARAIRFCEATLAYGRVSERAPRLVRTPLAPIFAELPDLAALSAHPVAVAVAVAVAAGGLSVQADPEQLGRALANLVRNAVQALDGAKVADATVRVTAAREEPGRITILVTDHGPGLPARARENLFAPFAGSMRSGGTGLGLPIAAELIGIMGGTLTLDTLEGGARFRIVLAEG